jgi:type IV pilus assembly protein PilX
MSTYPRIPRAERGMALLSSLLLLMVITLMALAMFKGTGTQEKIAGNLREKDRALHSAESAQQYGEWWLLQGSNAAVGPVSCNPGDVEVAVNSNATIGQICTSAQTVQLMFGATNYLDPNNWTARIEYQPQGMVFSGHGTNNDIAYARTPAFFISDLGLAADGAGEAYQIDAYGYGGSLSSVAIVESVYEVQQGVVNRGGL